MVDYKKEELVVTFTLLDRPKAVGSNVAVVYPEKGLMDALDALNYSVNNEKLKVQFQGGKCWLRLISNTVIAIII